METKHTPGPYRIIGAEIRSHCGESIARVCSSEADACLIAASPDLLDAVRQCQDYIFCDEGVSATALRRVLDAAIAKATETRVQ